MKGGRELLVVLSKLRPVVLQLAHDVHLVENTDRI